MINNNLLAYSEEYFEYKKFAEENVSNDKKTFIFFNNNFITKSIYKNSRFVNLNIFDFTILNFLLRRFYKLILKTFNKHVSKKNEGLLLFKKEHQF